MLQPQISGGRRASPSLFFLPVDEAFSYDEAVEELIKPLPACFLKVRPGATNKQKTKALALAYYDWRVMANRLNRVVGRRNWYAQLTPWGPDKLICTLTILGVPKDSSGEARKEGGKERDNPGTSMEAQAKRRAMAEHGLNYLYFLPQVWGNYDPGHRRLMDDPAVLVAEMYRTARIPNLDLRPYLTARADTLVRPLATEAREAGHSRRPMSVSLEERFLSIRDLCKALTRPEPDYHRLDEVSALVLLQQLREAYYALPQPA